MQVAALGTERGMDMILELLQRRRSVRRYTEETISEEALDQILRAGLLAPSSRAIFPVEFIVVRDRDMLLQLSRAKTAGSGMLAKANAAIVAMGDKERSDAWIEDCSLAMIFMQLAAAEMGVGNCWVQCRGRVSQQKKGEPITAMSEDIALAGDAQKPERLVAATIAQDQALTDNMSADEFLHELLGIPERYAVEAILSLGMPDQNTKPHDMPEITPEKVHRERY